MKFLLLSLFLFSTVYGLSLEDGQILSRSKRQLGTSKHGVWDLFLPLLQKFMPVLPDLDQLSVPNPQIPAEIYPSLTMAINLTMNFISSKLPKDVNQYVNQLPQTVIKKINESEITKFNQMLTREMNKVAPKEIWDAILKAAIPTLQTCNLQRYSMPRNENWMALLPTYAKYRPLSKLAIPGSHNSFSSNLGTDLAENLFEVPQIQITTIAIQFLNILKNMILPERLRPILELTVKKFTQTQELSLGQQLEAGIRYFDFRVCKVENTIYFCHGLLAGKVEEELDEIVPWMNSHPKEIVVFGFHKFYGMNPSAHAGLVRYLMNKFRVQPAEGYDSLGKLTLDAMWINQMQVIVFYEDYAGPYFWNFQKAVTTRWPKKENKEDLLPFVSQNYFRDRKNYPNKAIIVQGILTPSSKTYTKHMRCGLKKTSSYANSEMKKWIRALLYRYIDADSNMSIVITDFVGYPGLIGSIISLNIKDSVSKNNEGNEQVYFGSNIPTHTSDIPKIDDDFPNLAPGGKPIGAAKIKTLLTTTTKTTMSKDDIQNNAVKQFTNPVLWRLRRIGLGRRFTG